MMGGGGILPRKLATSGFTEGEKNSTSCYRVLHAFMKAKSFTGAFGFDSFSQIFPHNSPSACFPSYSKLIIFKAWCRYQLLKEVSMTVHQPNNNLWGVRNPEDTLAIEFILGPFTSRGRGLCLYLLPTGRRGGTWQELLFFIKVKTKFIDIFSKFNLVSTTIIKCPLGKWTRPSWSNRTVS